MLRNRVLTALVLIPFVVAGVLKLSPAALSGVLAGVMLLGAWEWSALSGLQRRGGRLLYVASVAVLLLLGGQLTAQPGGEALVLAAGGLWWLAALAWVVRYQLSGGVRPVMPAAAQRGWIGFAVLVPAWAGLSALHAMAPSLLLYLLVLIWAADTGAYFAGRRFGRRKLALHVSPGKSWEGVAGGALLASAVALACGALLFGFAGTRLGLFLALSVVTVFVSVLGDLFESLIKRYTGVKDSGTLLPGHGGVLDRIDSLTAAGPLFAIGMLGLEAWR